MLNAFLANWIICGFSVQKVPCVGDISTIVSVPSRSLLDAPSKTRTEKPETSTNSPNGSERFLMARFSDRFGLFRMEETNQPGVGRPKRAQLSAHASPAAKEAWAIDRKRDWCEHNVQLNLEGEKVLRERIAD
jgi:hypothetical protein